MTVNDFINFMLSVPNEFRDAPLEFEVDVNQVPDDSIPMGWLKGYSIPTTTDPTQRRQYVSIELEYS